MQLKFEKWNGLGNDFVIVNGAEEVIEDYAKAAAEVCDRHFGIGADGLVILLPCDQEGIDFEMRIFNSDGSEAEMCGNATRCIAKYIASNQLSDKKELRILTKAGVISPALVDMADGSVGVRVNMGKPRLTPSEIPVISETEEMIVAQPITAGEDTFYMTTVSMGNPHCVIFVDDITKIALAEVGPKLETHERFPRKINVEFAEVLDRKHIRMRVWERGAGITLACGTGSCATIVAAVLNDKTERQAEIILDGGTLHLDWAEEDGNVYMTGPATKVFTGIYEKV
ncbi:MAG: diaminopimelate epimerase [Selenomonadales bacterium]|nr:diaminopimelate epimerase [Selenomonadales bacterium]